MLARFSPFPVAHTGLATIVRTALCAMVLCGASTAALDAQADTGDGGEDTGETGDSGDGGTTLDPADTGSAGDTADTGTDGGSSDNGFQGDGPAELAGEEGGGCPMAGQSAAVFGFFLTLGVAGRRRTGPTS